MRNKSILHVVIPEELTRALDDYRFEMRFDSKAQAVRFLLDYALGKKPKPKPRLPGEGGIE